MKTKDKKLLYILIAAMLVVVCFSIVIIFIYNNASSSIYITLYSPLNGSKKVVKMAKGSMINDKLSPIEVEGYEFIGYFYNNDLTLKVEETDIFNSSVILKAGYSKIIKKSDNSFVNEITALENNKYVTIIADENNYLTQEELENILSYNPIYLNLSGVNFETSTLLKRTFLNQTNLKTIFLPKNITTIGEECFKNCYLLEQINFSNVLENIETKAFYNCTSLKSFTAPNSLNSIGDYVFEGCNINSLSLGPIVNNISSKSFYNAVIKNVSIDALNTSYILTDGVIYTRDYKSLIYVTNDVKERLNINSLTQSIEPYACYNNKNITSVVLNSNISNINEGSFKNCENLEEVLFLIQTNYTIHDSAFENCSSLSEVRFSVGLKEIGKSSFKNCNNLKTVIFNLSTESGIENISKIGNSVFKNCKSLNEIIVPDTVEEIGSELFNGCTSLKTVTLSSKISVIPDRTFYNNTSLETIITNSSITEIGDYCFAMCTNLKNISSLFVANKLGVGAFRNCESLTAVNFNNIIEIKPECFYNCTSLTSISFDRLEEIGEKSFNNCVMLESFYISSNLRTFSEDAFDGCTSLAEFIGSSTSQFTIDGGVLYNNQKNAIICYPEGKKDENFTISESVLNIYGIGLFKNLYLKNINVDASNVLYSSVDGVLYNKDKTTLYKYPSGKETATINVLEGVLHIGSYAFAFNENIEGITFPSSVISFGEGCLEKTINLKSLSVPFIGKDNENNRYIGYFFGAHNYNLNYEYMPQGLTNIIVTKDSEVPEYAFYDCYNVKYIEFNESVVSVNKYAFYNASSLEEVYFKGNIVKVSEYAFNNLSSFKTLTFGFSSDLVLEDNSFGNLTLVLSVRVHNNGQNLAQAYKTQLLSKFYTVYSRASRWSWSFV